jgi:predicted ABC-type transport system involved in lysophospholipase L1 biosynthesis ATPase subunit
MISSKPPVISKGDILLFEVENQNHNQSQLKDFLHFLKFCGKRGALKFSHLEESATLIKGLTLKENILLDSGLETKKSRSLVKILEDKGQIYLARLAESITNLNMYPNEVDLETKKLTTLIKAMTSNSDYLLLEKPAKYLSKTNTELFLGALFQSMTQRGQILLLTSEQRNLWLSHVTKVVTRSSSGRFTLDAVLSQNEVVATSHLEFIHPAQSDKKAA